MSAAVRLEATTASWAGLSGDVSLTQSKVVVAGVPLTELRPTRLTFTEGVLRIVDLEWQAGDARIAARGSVSLEGDQPLDVSVDGNLDLRMLGALLPEARWLDAPSCTRVVAARWGPPSSMAKRS